jgi:hypothetical protein
MQDLANDYSVNGCVVRRYAACNKWVAKRIQFRQDIGAKAIHQVSEIVDLARENFDGLTDKACDLIVAQIAEQMISLDEDVIDPQIMREYVDVIKAAQDVKYRRLGIPAPSHITVDDDRANPPADSVEDEIKLAVDDAMRNAYTPLALPEPKAGNGGGNGNGSDNGTD